MSNQNAELIRRAYLAYAEGNLDPMLELVDPDVEWIAGSCHRAPDLRICRGRPDERRPPEQVCHIIS
jgi:ketosteroid isomerase-like protein